MNISLTPELERLVQEKVKSGLYNNASEVIRDALRLLVQRDSMGRLYEGWLAAEVEIGWQQLERGEGREYDMNRIVEAAKSASAA